MRASDHLLQPLAASRSHAEGICAASPALPGRRSKAGRLTWTGTYISNQLETSVTLIASVNPNGASPVQILLPSKGSFGFNSGVTLFNVTSA